MSSAAPWDVNDALSLNSIREALIRQEDTIIFALIERAQFGRNVDGINYVTSDVNQHVPICASAGLDPSTSRLAHCLAFLASL